MADAAEHGPPGFLLFHTLGTSLPWKGALS